LKYSLKIKEQFDPYWIFILSLICITPDLLLFPLKLGGKVRNVPLGITERKQYTFAVKWVIKLLRDKFKRFTILNITDILVSAIYGKGLAIEKKKSVYMEGSLNRHLIRFFR